MMKRQCGFDDCTKTATHIAKINHKEIALCKFHADFVRTAGFYNAFWIGLQYSDPKPIEKGDERR